MRVLLSRAETEIFTNHKKGLLVSKSMSVTLFFGKKFKRCRKHKVKYVFYCFACYDPQWQIPIPLRLSPVRE